MLLHRRLKNKNQLQLVFFQKYQNHHHQNAFNVLIILIGVVTPILYVALMEVFVVLMTVYVVMMAHVVLLVLYAVVIIVVILVVFLVNVVYLKDLTKIAIILGH